MQSPWTTLVTHCVGAQRVTIAAPYMKVAVLQQLLEQVGPGAHLECFTRWTPHDIFAGTTDTACRSLVLRQGGRFYLHNRLHAKYYRFDDQILIGSANCTAPGLNYRQAGNLEILCRPDQSFDREEFENQLRAEANEVSDEEMEFWLACPVNTTRTPIPGDAVTNTLEDWKPLTRFPEYLWSVYTNQAAEVTDPTQRERAKADLQVLRPPPQLSREQFDLWMKSCLVSAPFISSVAKVEGTSQEYAWATLANEWGLETSAAARARSTTQNWVRYFRVTQNP